MKDALASRTGHDGPASCDCTDGRVERYSTRAISGDRSDRACRAAAGGSGWTDGCWLESAATGFVVNVPGGTPHFDTTTDDHDHWGARIEGDELLANHHGCCDYSRVLTDHHYRPVRGRVVSADNGTGRFVPGKVSARRRDEKTVVCQHIGLDWCVSRTDVHQSDDAGALVAEYALQPFGVWSRDARTAVVTDIYAGADCGCPTVHSGRQSRDDRDSVRPVAGIRARVDSLAGCRSRTWGGTSGGDISGSSGGVSGDYSIGLVVEPAG